MAKFRSKKESVNDAVVTHWVRARNELPEDVMEAVRAFHSSFYPLAEKHQLSPPHVVVALSHLLAPCVYEHVRAERPSSMSADDWLCAMYEAIVDSVVVAHSLLEAVEDGKIVADGAGNLQRAPVH